VNEGTEQDSCSARVLQSDPRSSGDPFRRTVFDKGPLGDVTRKTAYDTQRSKIELGQVTVMLWEIDGFTARNTNSPGTDAEAMLKA
jgi:hypothetical protein